MTSRFKPAARPTYEEDFKQIISVSSRADGTEIKIADCGRTVIDGFEERNSAHAASTATTLFFLGRRVWAENPRRCGHHRMPVKSLCRMPARAFCHPGLAAGKPGETISNMFSGRLALLSKNAFGGSDSGVCRADAVSASAAGLLGGTWAIAIAYMGALWVLPTIGLTS